MQHTRLLQIWQFLRRLTGDDAYEQYLAHHQCAHISEPVLTRQQYYRYRLELKSRGVNRCC